MNGLRIMILLLLSSSMLVAKESKSARKDKKIVGKEERLFAKNLKKKKDTASTYLLHANNLSGIPSQAKRAAYFYQLAVKKDSANPEIFKGYGRYLFDYQHSYAESGAMLEKGLAIAKSDNEIRKYLVQAQEKIALQDADDKMRDFGTMSIKVTNPDSDYKSTTKFDSLKKLLADPGFGKNYGRLLKRYYADDTTLTAGDMYLMIVGYSAEGTYNPFNYNDITELRMIASHDLDRAIKRGLELTVSNPLNPSLNRELMYYYRRKNQPDTAEHYHHRIRQYFNGMLYSGDGTCSKPYVSLWAKEEYNFIAYLGGKASDFHAMGTCAGQMSEEIEMTNLETKKTENIFFNVALIYMHTVGK